MLVDVAASRSATPSFITPDNALVEPLTTPIVALDPGPTGLQPLPWHIVVVPSVVVVWVTMYGLMYMLYGLLVAAFTV